MSRTIAGRYRLETELGRGGMGVVWQARDEFLDRDVAVKEITLPPSAEDHDALRERFLREARATARLDHPGIIDVYDVITEDGLPWIVMRLVRGRSLERLVLDDGPLPPARVAQIGLVVLDALTAAHAEGILHRDVTPRNVLVGDDGRVVLTDFGIAAIDGATALTHTGRLIGSPGYMAPERLRGRTTSGESDLWSLGATLYFAVEGRPAYDAPEAAALIGMVLTEEPAPVRRAGPLQPVVQGLLAKDPARRLAAGPARQRLSAVAGTRPDATAPRPRQGAQRTRQEQRTKILPPEPATPTRQQTLARRPPPATGKVLGWVVFGVVAVIVINVVWNPLHIIGEGKYRKPPASCGGLSQTTLRLLVPDPRATSSSCRWLGSDQRSSFTVVVNQPFSRAAWHSAEHQAAGYLKDYAPDGSADQPGIGDGARIKDDSGTTTIYFRVDNLVVGFYYTTLSNSHDGALLAARQMVATIERS